MSEYYAYIHARPDGRVFYVGKGSGYRSGVMSCGRNSYHKNIINKYGPANILVGTIDCSSEEIAFDLERGLIKCFKRSGVALVNQTEGGDGVRGADKSYMQSDAYRAALSKALTGRQFSDDHKRKMSEHMKERYSSEDARNEHSVRMKNVLSSEVARKKMSVSHTDLTASDEARAKMSVSAKLAWARNPRKHTAEAKAKMSASKIRSQQ